MTVGVLRSKLLASSLSSKQKAEMVKMFDKPTVLTLSGDGKSMTGRDKKDRPVVRLRKI